MDVIPGDIVLVRQKVFGTQHKIEDRWELPVYKVLEQCGDSPLYKVQKIGGVGGEDPRVLHRNMLFAFIGVREMDEDDTEKEVRYLPFLCWIHVLQLSGKQTISWKLTLMRICE